jgi:hypothetical protein
MKGVQERNAESDEMDEDGVKGSEEPQSVKRIGFEEMAKEVGKKWKIDPETLVEYKRRATEEKERYKAELELYEEKQPIGSETKRKQPESKVSEETKRISLASGEG